jgi:hypothetical protein
LQLDRKEATQKRVPVSRPVPRPGIQAVVVSNPDFAFTPDYGVSFRFVAHYVNTRHAAKLLGKLLLQICCARLGTKAFHVYAQAFERRCAGNAAGSRYHQAEAHQRHAGAPACQPGDARGVVAVDIQPLKRRKGALSLRPHNRMGAGSIDYSSMKKDCFHRSLWKIG